MFFVAGLYLRARPRSSVLRHNYSEFFPSETLCENYKGSARTKQNKTKNKVKQSRWPASVSEFVFTGRARQG